MKESEDFNYLPFVDVLFNVLIVVVILLALNKSEKKSDPSMSANVIYQIVMDWDGKSTTDMDLWAKDPAGNITGFKNREGGDGSLFALAQDDRGAMTDTKPDGSVVEVNQEIVSIRGTKPGEYIVTGYAYARADKQNLKVSCKLVKIKPFQEIKTIERTFTATAQEQTFFRFKLDEKGEVVDINELPGNVAKFDGPVPEFSLEGPQQ
jgi:ABC-type phosphate transport system substrate-binding protein